MKRVLLIFLLIIIVSLFGCKKEVKSVEYNELSIVDQIAQLEMQKTLFANLDVTFDEYAKIHDLLYPEDQKLKDEVVYSVVKSEEPTDVKGEELIGLDLQKQKEYIENKLNLEPNETFDINELDISVSDIYKDKSLDWYYVFTLEKIVVSSGELYIPSRYTLQKVDENYKVIEYSSDKSLGYTDEKTKDDFLKKSPCSTFYSEPVTYIKTISY